MDLYDGSKSIVLAAGDGFAGSRNSMEIVYALVGLAAIAYGVLVVVHEQSVKAGLTSVVHLEWKSS